MNNRGTETPVHDTWLFWRLVIPFVLALVVVISFAAISVNLAAREQDRIAAESSAMTMRAVIGSLEGELDRLVYDNSWWDMAVEKLVEAPQVDLDWADNNIGLFAAETYGISDTFVLTGSDRTWIAYDNGVLAQTDAFDRLGGNLTALVSAARAAPIVEPVPVSAYFEIDGRPYRVAAGALTRQTQAPGEVHLRPRSVLVYARPVTAALLMEVAAQFGIEGLELVRGDAPPDGSSLSLPLSGLDGQPVSWLVWTAPQPGSDLLKPLRPWRALALVAVLVLVLIFVRQVLRTARRITEDARVLAEKEHQLAQSSKLAVLGEMSAGMVHELNQPLNIIRMAAEATGSALRDRDTPTELRTIGAQLDIIVGQSDRMAETIRSMRTFSRDDYGRKIVFDPCASARQAVGWLRGEFDERNIAFDVRIPAYSGHVYGEPARFEQVLVNLLMNARDAIVGQRAESSELHDGGRVTLEVGETSDREAVTIEVRDTGGGIASDELERVFEPFFTTKAPGEGTGLGLSISYGIVNGMDGSLTVRNQGSGAVFRVELPRVSPAVDGTADRAKAS